MEKSQFISVACVQLRLSWVVKVDSQRTPRELPPALDSKLRQGKQKAASDLTEYSNQSHLLIPQSIKASFLGPKHGYKISTQPDLLRVVNSQIISNSRFLFAHSSSCSRYCKCTATSRRAETLCTFRTFTQIGTLQPISKTHFVSFTSSMNNRNEKSTTIVDETVYCVTAVDCTQLCKESTASNKNYVELNVALHQKSKFLRTIVYLLSCCVAVLQTKQRI